MRPVRFSECGRRRVQRCAGARDRRNVQALPAPRCGHKHHCWSGLRPTIVVRPRCYAALHRFRDQLQAASGAGWQFRSFGPRSDCDLCPRRNRPRAASRATLGITWAQDWYFVVVRDINTISGKKSETLWPNLRSIDSLGGLSPSRPQRCTQKSTSYFALRAACQARGSCKNTSTSARVAASKLSIVRASVNTSHHVHR